MTRNASVPRLMQRERIRPNFFQFSPLPTPSQRTGSTDAEIFPFDEEEVCPVLFDQIQDGDYYACYDQLQRQLCQHIDIKGRVIQQGLIEWKCTELGEDHPLDTNQYQEQY